MNTAMNKNAENTAARAVQVKVSVDPGIAAAFKAACTASNISMTAELSRFMLEYAKGEVKRKVAPNYSTRRHRRTAIKAMLNELEQIKSFEESVLENTPENLVDSSPYEATAEAISTLEEAIDALTQF
jgi:hypothetical protein